MSALENPLSPLTIDLKREVLKYEELFDDESRFSSSTVSTDMEFEDPNHEEDQPIEVPPYDDYSEEDLEFEDPVLGDPSQGECPYVPPLEEGSKKGKKRSFEEIEAFTFLGRAPSPYVRGRNAWDFFEERSAFMKGKEDLSHNLQTGEVKERDICSLALLMGVNHDMPLEEALSTLSS